MLKNLRQHAAQSVIRYIYERNPTLFPGDIINSLFHRHYYHSPETWVKNRFLGVPVLQSPFDLYLYQQLLYEVRPQCVVQTGVAHGGSILFFATMLDMIGADAGCICVGVDIKLSESARRVSHPRVHLLEGDAVSAEMLAQISALLGGRTGLVSLDSDHTKGHVLKELRAYSGFVAAGSYLVVEDTNIGRHGVCQGFGPGPMEALQEFLSTNRDFVTDDALWERNLVSFHQHGWLKRVR